MTSVPAAKAVVTKVAIVVETVVANNIAVDKVVAAIAVTTAVEIAAPSSVQVQMLKVRTKVALTPTPVAKVANNVISTTITVAAAAVTIVADVAVSVVIIAVAIIAPTAVHPAAQRVKPC